MFSKIFPKNVHVIERFVRIALGAGLLSLVFFGPQTWWGLLGIVPLATGILGSCPPYTLLGINTRSSRKKEESATSAA